VLDSSVARENWSPRSTQARVTAYDAALPTEPTPSNDVITDADRAAIRAILEGGLRAALQHSVGAQLSRAVATARVLVDQVSGAHSAALRSIVDAVEQTEGMLEDVVEFLRVGENGSVQVNRRRINLKPVCERVIDSIQGRHPTHALHFNSDPRVLGEWDPDAIAAMLSRLILNAIEHGSADGVVRIRLRGLADEVILEVWNGGGILEDIPVHRLFEPFARESPRGSDTGRGLGLGLCLANAIARAHDGRIEVQSDEHRGTTFRVALPSA